MSTDDLTAKLRAWLQSEGYPFELQTGRALREAGWDVFHGRHYTDPDTGKLREIDLEAAWGPYIGFGEPRGSVSIHLVCECKVSQKPWVVFTSQNTDDSLHRLAGHLAPGPFGATAFAHGVITSREKLSAFVPGPRIGHGVTKAFGESRSGDPSGPFAAVVGALAAASAFSREYYSIHLRGPSRPDVKPFVWIGIHIPLVVVGGRLFEFYLDHEGKEILEERDRIHVLAHGLNSGQDPVLVQIVSGRGMVEFAKAALHEARTVAEAILPEAGTLWKSFRGDLQDAS